MGKRLRNILCAGIAILIGSCQCISAWAAVDTQAVFEIESNIWESWPQGPEIAGDTAVVMELDTGTVLYNKGMNAQRYPASITKIMTSLLVIENCDLNGQVTMTETGMADAFVGSSNCQPQLGEVFTVEQCLQMSLIKSANDVSTQLAEYTSGSVQGFADLMNSRAAQLGCQNTHFCNASGLENENHYTSAYDMALITKEALKYDKFREIIAMPDVTIPATNMSGERYYGTHIQMMVPENVYYYEGCFGGKTGHTDISKSTLVVCAERNGVTLIGVVMGGIDSNLICDDMRAILDYGFQNFTKTDVSWGCETLSGGKAMLPNQIQPQNLTMSAVKADDTATITYEFSGRPVGTAVMTEGNFAIFQKQNGVDVKVDEEEPNDPTVVTVSQPTKEDVSTETHNIQGSGKKLMMYLAMGILGILIFCGVVLIFRGTGRKKRRRRRRR